MNKPPNHQPELGGIVEATGTTKTLEIGGHELAVTVEHERQRGFHVVSMSAKGGRWVLFLRRGTPSPLSRALGGGRTLPSC